MIIVMKAGAAKKDRNEVLKRIRELGYKPHVIHGATRDVIGAVGDERGKLVLQSIESMHGVESVVPILQPYKLASKEVKKEPSLIRISDTVTIGGREIVVMAGPCSVESERQIIETAIAVKEAGASVLRGGAFKPRTSPYSFQGLEEEGLKLLAKAREISGPPVRYRGGEPGDRRTGGRICGHPADRGAQRPELRPVEKGRPVEQAGAAQAGDVDDHPGVPDERGICHERGEPGGYPLRARNPHLRDRHPQYP